jgi:hypothetical protein
MSVCFHVLKLFNLQGFLSFGNGKELQGTMSGKWVVLPRFWIAVFSKKLPHKLGLLAYALSW